jgi:hypothetical protein
MSLEDENILICLLLREHKNMNMAGCSQLKLTFYFMERTHKTLHLHVSHEVLYVERLWVYPQVLFESFSLTELLISAVFQNYEVTLGQMLNYFE